MCAVHVFVMCVMYVIYGMCCTCVSMPLCAPIEDIGAVSTFLTCGSQDLTWAVNFKSKYLSLLVNSLVSMLFCEQIS